MVFIRSSTALQLDQFQIRILPILSDRYAASGVALGHYFHQDLWAARHIYADSPACHIDVGSRIDGFVAHLLCFRDVEVVDIRALESRVTGLTFRQADMMSDGGLDIQPVPSVSCLHALEHFGLGRYGDPVNPDGWRIGLKHLAKLVSRNGRLYIGAPIGKPAIEFNAQRIFHPQFIIDEAARHGLSLLVMAYIDDSGEFNELAMPLSIEDSVRLAKMDYGCGLFLFVKDS